MKIIQTFSFSNLERTDISETNWSWNCVRRRPSQVGSFWTKVDQGKEGVLFKSFYVIPKLLIMVHTVALYNNIVQCTMELPKGVLAFSIYNVRLELSDLGSLN